MEELGRVESLIDSFERGVLVSLVRNDDGPGMLDDAVLDEFNIPFGSWIEEAVNWITLNMGGALDVIAWPFEFLLENLVDRFLIAIPWLVVVAIMFVIAWLVRNLTVAMGSARARYCGLLGNEFRYKLPERSVHSRCSDRVHHHRHSSWSVLARRLGLQVMRLTLDAMQVIHSFVYLLPFVYFWGVGQSRQRWPRWCSPSTFDSTDKPWDPPGSEDVVEASRAYGARELRVARRSTSIKRPAIMTGINQTLLLAFSMLGIAAILGAGGMEALLFRALGQQDVLAASAGLGFFLLAVILDRISQTQTGGAGLFSRMSTAWRARREPVSVGEPRFQPFFVVDPK